MSAARHSGDLAELVDLLDRGPSEVRVAAAASLGALADPRAIEPLERLARRGVYVEATAAVEALSAFAGAAALPLFIDALRASDAKAQTDELKPVGQQPRHISKHRGQLHEAEVQDLLALREAAARALAELRDPSAVEALAAALSDPHPSAPRRAARRALLAIGTPEATEAVTAWKALRRHRRAAPEA